MQEQNEFDVVVMGGGIGGSFQARHLMLNIPGIRVAVVEPQSAEEIAKIGKIGESTVEIAGSFMVKELGLGAYLTERQLPKNGLNFHWPKDIRSTESMDDYWSVWALRQPTGHAWQVHRGRLEADLTEMNRAAGITLFEAKVTDFEVAEGDAPNQVHIEAGDDVKSTLTCRYLIDAAGRAFLTGRKFKNISHKPRDKAGIKNGAAWVRVRGVDRSLFHDELDRGDTSTVRYYGTNHFFGHGHWLWMIPLSREEMEISIGVMHHHDYVPARSLNSQEKFEAFLENNHAILHQLVRSGEVVDFAYMGSPSHVPQQVFSSDGWGAIGDAIYFGDAFYSVGISALCVTIECQTDLIRSTLAGEPGTERKRTGYNDYVAWFAHTNAHTYRHHPKVLGDASIMSWRIYFEYMWWFGALVPTYVGKWHLDLDYIAEQLENCPRHIHNDIYEELNDLSERGVNVGLMDCYRADQLPFGRGFYPDMHHVPYLENTEYEPRQLNIYRSVAATHWYSALWWMKLQQRAHGIGWLVRPMALSVLARLMRQVIRVGVRARLHDLELLGRRRSWRWNKLEDAFAAYRRPDATNKGDGA